MSDLARRSTLASEELAFVTFDVNGLITSWSKGAERILLHSEAEVLGRSGEIVFTEEDRAGGVPAQELEAARAGRADDERWHVRKDGSRFWGSGVMTAIRDAADHPMGFAKVVRDLTGRRRFVESVREYALFESDPAGLISSWPPGAERLFGYSVEEVVGTAAARLFEAGGGGDARWMAEPIRDENGELRGTAWILREETGAREFEALANLVPELLWRIDADGQVQWHNQRWRDYTGRAPDDFDWSAAISPDERSKAQRQFREALRSGQSFRHEHRLRRHDGVDRWFLMRAEPVRDDAGRILHWLGAAIDIEEPRRVARELHDSLGRQLAAARAELADCREHAAEDSARTLRILGELDTHIDKLSREVSALSDRLHPVILEDSGLPAALRRLAGEFDVPVELALEDLAPGGPLSAATAAYRIAEEALGNAGEHAAADCRMRIVLTTRDGTLELTISDTRSGFPSEAVSMRERARQAGGTLEIDSTEGGTTVRLRLPWPPTVARQAKPRIVIADDHDATRYILRRFAESECEVVAEVVNGLEAVQTAEKLRPELMVLDVSMPVMGGVDAARRIHERFPEIRIIFASQHTMREYAEEAFRAGGQGYIVKQAVASELAPAIREVLAGKSFRSPLVGV